MRILAHAFAIVVLAATPAMAQEIPQRLQNAWPNTDFSLVAVDPAEIISGGPPKDGIPAITGPTMAPVAEETGLAAREPVMSIELEGEPARAYPVRYLMWHEIVNDVAGGVPIAVTFCPLCNSGLVFDRRIGARELEFGVSGLLRHSDMIMYDRQTESWWQQMQGRAIVGALMGAELAALPALLESWQSFQERNPQGLVMQEPTGYGRPYGSNPYAGYDSGRPFLYQGEQPPHGIEPLARVLRIGARAWPLARLSEAGEISEAGYRITWTEGQASALDTRIIAEGKEVGDIRAYDAETGKPVIHDVVFAFAFHAFEPEGEWMLGE